MRVKRFIIIILVILMAVTLVNAGYSTAIDENGNKVYAERLINLIRQYDLQLIDSEAQNTK